MLLAWRKRINDRLIKLASMISAMERLEELSFEASSEYEAAQGPRWDGLLGSTVKIMICALPVGLKYLMLDTAGSMIITSEEDRMPMHLRPLIAKRLDDFQHVRLRMRHICPKVLDTGIRSVATSKLQSLVVRLSVPFFPSATYETHDGYTEFDAQVCNGAHLTGSLYLYMIEAGANLVRPRPDLQKLRVSYRGSDINLMLAEYVKRQYMYVGAELFSYEDDGRELNGSEDDDEYLIVQGGF